MILVGYLFHDERIRPVTDGRQNPESQIRKKVWIKASADVVYRALTESKELERWFCDQATCTPREGGELLACWRTGKLRQKGRALITRLVPDTSMELLWVDDGGNGQERDFKHTLSYEIRSTSEMTELVVLDTVNTPTDEETYTFLDRGWNSVLLELKDHCEQKERTSQTRVKKSRQ